MTPDPADLFVARCESLARQYLGSEYQLDQTGQHHLVILNNDLALRFPRKTDTAKRVAEISDRFHRATQLGIPTPNVVDLRTGPPGEAVVVLQRRHGISAGQLLSQAGDPVLQRMGESLGQILIALRCVSGSDWPFESPRWRTLWSDLASKAHERPQPEREWVAAADHAAEVAAVCPLGLVHGDLANVNVLFSDSGAVNAVLDWDHAVIGDPAIDAAAVMFGLPTAAREAALAQSSTLGDDVARFEVYQETWALQEHLWRTGATSNPGQS